MSFWILHFASKPSDKFNFKYAMTEKTDYTASLLFIFPVFQQGGDLIQISYSNDHIKKKRIAWQNDVHKCLQVI